MPIRPSLRWYYPIDWPQVSHWVRFVRARGQCEQCRRPHAKIVDCMSDGSWRDPLSQRWHDGRGQPRVSPQTGVLRQTRVLLAAAHLDHDPSNNRRSNLRALCQRCHILHDLPHHTQQRWITYRKRWAVGDLFLGPYP